MRFTESVLAYRRSRVVAISAVMIAIEPPWSRVPGCFAERPFFEGNRIVT